eukprot:5484849-Alexandrium_andersonii.AAC.1
MDEARVAHAGEMVPSADAREARGASHSAQDELQEGHELVGRSGVPPRAAAAGRRSAQRPRALDVPEVS